MLSGKVYFLVGGLDSVSYSKYYGTIFMLPGAAHQHAIRSFSGAFLDPSSDIVVLCTQCWDLWATEVAFVLRVAFTRHNLLNFKYFPVSCLPHAVQNTLFFISFNKGKQFATTLYLIVFVTIILLENPGMLG